MTPRPPARLVPGQRRDALARLALGEAYLDRALLGDQTDDTERTASVGIACTAAIAFADAICLNAVQQRSAGDNHGAAIDLLRTVDATAARHLGTLLALKTQTQYGSTTISTEKAARAMRAVEHLAARAREI